MSKPLMTVLAPLAVFGSAAACATFAGSPGSADTYRIDAGTGTPHDIVRFTERTLDRYQFRIQRADTSAAYLIMETDWRGRYPLADEISEGVVEAMTRLTIRARSRNRSAGPGQDLRLVLISAENMVRMGDSLSWIRGYMTPMFKEYIDAIGNDIKLELNSGVRTF